MQNCDNSFFTTSKKSHTHACIIYDDITAYRQVAFRYILEGLNSNEKCIMAVDKYKHGMIFEDFANASLEIDAFIENKKLTIINPVESYSENKGFDPEKTVEFWQTESNKAIKDGYDGLRVVGEATFSLGSSNLTPKLIHYENMINKVLFPDYPFKSLCVYDKERYPAKVIKNAITAHPILFYNDELYLENIHYVPPEIYFKDNKVQDEVEIQLANLKKKNERALIESEERYKNIFENSVVGIFQSTPDGEFVTVNRALAKMLGYDSPKNFLRANKDIKNNFYVDPGVRKRFLSIMAKNGSVNGCEFEAKCKDGTKKWLSESTHAYFDANDKLIRFEGIITDIDRQKQIEAELKFQAVLLDQIQDHITATDLNGKILYVNEAECNSVKRTKEELIGSSIHIYGESPELGATQDQIIEATLKKGKWRGEIINSASDGTQITMDCRTQLIKDKSGKPVSMVGISTDITEQKKNLERLEQAQKMESIGSLAGGIAHDFNNILFPIVGMSELLLDDLPAGSIEHENTQEILKAGKRGADLVQQILAFSRQKKHKIIPTRIQQILKEVLKLIRASIPSNIDIVQTIQHDCGMVMADPTQIHQIAMNIMTNAYHAVDPAGGVIGIQLKEVLLEKENMPTPLLKPGRHAHLSITDNGHGIPRTLKNKIFEPYFTTKKMGKGTGLGLAVVYGIVKEHHGDIKVCSKEGEGTRFNIYLPLMEHASDTPPLDGMLKAATGTEKILLVDDETSIATLESQMLSRLGYQVKIETSSQNALKTFKSNPYSFDLVISDMTMPQITGDQLAKEIVSVRPETPIIICTGFSERLNKKQLEKTGVKGFLMKPILRTDLAKLVRKVLDESANSRCNLIDKT